MTAFIVAAGGAAPARGTPLSDLIPATIVAAIIVAVVAAVAFVHRTRGIAAIHRLDKASERWSGLPGWAAQPIVVATVALLVAVFGFYWDVSWHIDRGRDPGPFANPAHYFIIAGLAGIALAGVISLVVGVEKPTPTSVRLRDDWHVPVGGVLLTICGVIALAGFPLDDIWHRLFGQDVTLWGPTHIQMIGGASLATLAMWVLLEEGRRASRGRGQVRFLSGLATQKVLLGGAFLIGLSTLQGEFDFGVPQFRQLYHPVLIMLAASIAPVAVRVRGGRGSALVAVAFFLALRGGLTLLIGPWLGRSTLHFPLYLVEAVIVELVALRVPQRRQLTFGLWCGVGIATVGLAAEWAWSHIWMPLPWHASLLPEALVFAPLAALAGGVLGGMIGRALLPPGEERQPVPRGVLAGAWIVALLCVAWPLPMKAPSNLVADVTLSRVTATPLQVRPTIRLNRTDAATNAQWFDVTTWQGRKHGDGGLVIAPLHRTAPGTYTTDDPIPVSGNWKALIRLHKGRDLGVVPMYLPADPAIPAAEFPPNVHYRARFVADKKVLQREAVGGSVNLQRAAYGVLFLLGLVWIASLAWGLRRLGNEPPEYRRPEPIAPEPEPTRVPVGARS